MPRAWTKNEVDLIINDYFAMLLSELEGKPFNKTKHRNNLSPMLANRSMGSIEFKHQNISAVMIDLGLPYISGYKPRGNYQRLLKEKTAACLDSFPELIKAIEIDVNKNADLQNIDDILKALVYPPASKGYGMSVRENLADYNVKKSTLLRINYLEKEAANISLGSAGEKFVLKYEKTRLEAIEKFNLANRIEQVSETKGDWAGYDIRSFDDNGNDRFIEVKTTRYGIDTPFFVTKNELGFSTVNSSNYNLYRVFAFQENPKLFMLKGSLDKSCKLEPVQFRAHL